jgi:DnaK suppressor protein
METLSSANMKTFRALLLAERASILGASSLKLDVLEVSDNLSAEDQAPLIHDQFVALHYRRQESDKLKNIGLALDRLNSGGFGICQACAEPIPRKRLLAIPWAAHCVACQERLQDSPECEAGVEVVA